jgi:hypothetical protein
MAQGTHASFSELYFVYSSPDSDFECPVPPKPSNVSSIGVQTIAQEETAARK